MGFADKEVRKILGEIGEGPFGMIMAIALSPDDQFLAVGGMLSDNPYDGSAIRICHFPTGELRSVLKSHNNVVLDLCFSPDGRYLVSGSADMTVKVWDMEEFFHPHPDPLPQGRGEKIEPVYTFTEHSRQVYAVRIFPYQGDFRVVSAAWDNQVILYSLQQKEKLASFSRKDRATFLGVSDKYIACSGGDDREINIFDLNLKPVKTIASETIPTGLAFSPDGKLLLAGTVNNPYNCNIYDTQQNFKKIKPFQKHDNLTKSVTFADNDTAITGGGNNQDIWFWNPRTEESNGHIAGSGKRIWIVGIKGDEIAFGNTVSPKNQNDKGPLEKAFRLSDFTPFQPQDFSSFRRISTQFQDCTLSHTQGGPYGYKEGILLIKKNGELVTRIERDGTNGYHHRCYGFTPEGFILSGGASGQLKAL